MASQGPDSEAFEPYPLSLRLVNLIKWTLSNDIEDQDIRGFITLNAENLKSKLEWHIQGNHLFENLKALVFYCVCFEHENLSKYEKMLQKQIEIQILEDGAHFEQSPMYHCIILEGLLDLISLYDSYGIKTSFSQLMRTKAEQMTSWLNFILRPDKQFPLFNDSAYGICSEPEELKAYQQLWD